MKKRVLELDVLDSNLPHYLLDDLEQVTSFSEPVFS